MLHGERAHCKRWTGFEQRQDSVSENDAEQIQTAIARRDTPERSTESRNNNALGRSGGKQYTFIAPDGTIYRDVINLHAFADKYHLSTPHLLNVAQGKRSHHQHWVGFLQSGDLTTDAAALRASQKTQQFIIRGGAHYTAIAPDSTTYADITDIQAFARAHNLTTTHLHRVLTGKAKQHKGWTGFRQPDPE